MKWSKTGCWVAGFSGDTYPDTTCVKRLGYLQPIHHSEHAKETIVNVLPIPEPILRALSGRLLVVAKLEVFSSGRYMWVGSVSVVYNTAITTQHSYIQRLAIYIHDIHKRTYRAWWDSILNETTWCCYPDIYWRSKSDFYAHPVWVESNILSHRVTRNDLIL